MNPPSFDSSLESFPDLLAEQRRRRHSDPGIQRHMAVLDHLQAIRASYPGWRGPRPGEGVEGFCQVHGKNVWNQSRNAWCCHEGAHCRVLSVNASRDTIAVVLESGDDAGQILRLDFTDVWPPEWLFDHHPAAVREPVGHAACPPLFSYTHEET